MNKHIIPCLAAILAVSISQPCSAHKVTKNIHKSFEVKRGMALRLSHGDGDVTIKPWDRDVLDVRVHYDAEIKTLGSGKVPDFEVEFRQRNGLIHIIGKEIASGILGICLFSRCEYTYTIRAPDYIELDLNGDDGDVQIEGWRGKIDCSIDDGDVELRDTRAPRIKVKFQDGDVHVENCRGEFSLIGDDGDVTFMNCETKHCRIRLEDGDLEMRRCSGDLDIRTDDGDVTLSRVQSRNLDIKVQDATVEVDLAGKDIINVEISTDDGNIILDIGPGISAAFSIDVDDGTIRVDLPAAVKIEKGRHWMTGEMRGGKGRIRLRTADGSVLLRES